MTQKNIDVMDIIVNNMADGAKLSKALSMVYNKRNVAIPYSTVRLDVSVMNMGLSSRAVRALIRTKLMTIGDVIEYCKLHKLTEIANVGKDTGVEIFEAILDYCWDNMSHKEHVSFLIDTVERNSDNIREEIA
jgi:hypothetical protein